MAILTLITITTTITTTRTISLSVIILPLIIASCLGQGVFEQLPPGTQGFGLRVLLLAGPWDIKVRVP